MPMNGWPAKNDQTVIERGRVSLRTLILIRWIAIIGQGSTLLVVHLVFGFSFPLEIAFGVVGASALINLANMFQRPGAIRLGDRDATAYLAFDVLQLAALLFLSGGLQNPFSILLLAPVTIGATILSRRSILILTVLTILMITGLGLDHLPLPWTVVLELPGLYIFATWLSLTVATLFIVTYTWSVAEEGRRISDGLSATQLALAREQRVSAVGALAAAAAHELGSPLGTIAVIAKELARDLPPDSPFAEDANLLVSQTARCRTILSELSQKRDADGGEPFTRLPLISLVTLAGEPHHIAPITVRYVGNGDGSDEPELTRSPEIIHGIGNFIQNAIQFARKEVLVAIRWDQDAIAITITDDGPGFAPQLLSRLGEPYLSGRSSQAEHMGLGIFIAETLLQRTGATIVFNNRDQDTGAEVRVAWPRTALS